MAFGKFNKVSAQYSGNSVGTPTDPFATCRIDVPVGATVQDAVSALQRTSFIPADLPCKFTSRVGLGVYNPDTKETTFIPENFTLLDELLIVEGTLYIDCWLSRFKSAATILGWMQEAQKVFPALLLRQLEKRGVCDEYGALCDKYPVDHEKRSGPMNKRHLLKQAREVHGLVLKNKPGFGISVPGMERGIELYINKGERNKIIGATVLGLPEVYGMTSLNIFRLHWHDALQLSGRRLDERPFYPEPFATSVEEFVDIVLSLRKIAYMILDTFEAHNEAGSK